MKTIVSLLFLLMVVSCGTVMIEKSTVIKDITGRVSDLKEIGGYYHIYLPWDATDYNVFFSETRDGSFEEIEKYSIKHSYNRTLNSILIKKDDRIKSLWYSVLITTKHKERIQ